MTDDPTGTPAASGSAARPPAGLAAELRWVHDMLRHDLQVVRELAAATTAGGSVQNVRDTLTDLKTNGALFQLRVNCLSYCQFVHLHHGHEDELLFPAVRRAAPALREAVDRLEADHRRVAELLVEVERHAAGLESDAARAALGESLTELATHLLEHLAYEEVTLKPVLDSWDEALPPELAAARAAYGAES